jgi:hypothetical protein
MGTFDPVEFGEHRARLVGLDNRLVRVEMSLDEANVKLDTVINALAERRGERKAIATMATLAGGLGSLIVTMFYKWMEK